MDDSQDPDTVPSKPKRTGPKPKKLVEATYSGIEVGRGDNKKVIDPKEVEKLAALGMKITEMSEWFGVDDSTLNYNFKHEIQKGKHNLNCSLRQAQIRLALSGNATMLIWLGRNILGQTDSDNHGEANTPLPWQD